MKKNIKDIFLELLKYPIETEFIEFKKAEKNFDFNKLGMYFSALSNEANLKNKEYGWLIFGVEDKTKKITGTNYRQKQEELDSLKKEIADQTTNRITFLDIYELSLAEGRVLLFKIPSAPKGIPIAWKGHYYGREGESISPLNIYEIEYIRSQIKPDWSSQICDKANINDLMPEAILKARIEFKKKNPKLASDSEKWDHITFLNKAKVTINGKITNTAIILLGLPESEHFISPFVSKITWILRKDKNIDEDYQHFSCPFILTTEEVLNEIRNLHYRYLPDNTLFPEEIYKYEPYVIREALHNCILHQDYSLQSRISIVELSDELIFTNAGSFIPETVENVIEHDAPPSYYRNQFLANAMVNLNMIDTVGGGIKKMFMMQKNRFFPMPSYILNNKNEVKVKIFGKIIDEKYTRILKNRTDLEIKTIIALDKVQKKEKIEKKEYKELKKIKLIEGRYPTIFVASKIAEITGDKVQYIKNRTFDKGYYKKMIIEFIKKYGSATRKEIDSLLISKISEVLSEKQKIKKISNLIYEMSFNDKLIENKGSDRVPKWVLK